MTRDATQKETFAPRRTLELAYFAPIEPIPIIAEIWSENSEVVAEIGHHQGRCVLHTFGEEYIDLRELIALYERHADRLEAIARTESG